MPTVAAMKVLVAGFCGVAVVVDLVDQRAVQDPDNAVSLGGGDKIGDGLGRAVPLVGHL
jgi:hypothetical protein